MLAARKSAQVHAISTLPVISSIVPEKVEGAGNKRNKCEPSVV